MKIKSEDILRMVMIIMIALSAIFLKEPQILWFLFLPALMRVQEK